MSRPALRGQRVTVPAGTPLWMMTGDRPAWTPLDVVTHAQTVGCVQRVVARAFVAGRVARPALAVVMTSTSEITVPREALIEGPRRPRD